ncbi:MAG TPA: ribonuclease III [Nitrospiria bacterium]|nr:ribonuclease III [Nitrospiria bacterium]
MNTDNLDLLQKTIAYSFRQPGHLRSALTHKSYVNENPGTDQEDNERLEYLGDAVLDLVISEFLFQRLKTAREGELSKIKAMIVSRPALSEIARSLALGDFILLGKGEEQSRGRMKPSLLADTLEAVIAAIYLDGGFQEAEKFIGRWFAEKLEMVLTSEPVEDYKTEFQEVCQKEFDILPEYRLVRATGPDHDKTFEMELTVQGKVMGRGAGKNKKEAEQQAASEALGRIRTEKKEKK